MRPALFFSSGGTISATRKISQYPAFYRSRHQKEYELHTASKEALKEFGVKALPKPEKPDTQIEKLEAE